MDLINQSDNGVLKAQSMIKGIMFKALKEIEKLPASKFMDLKANIIPYKGGYRFNRININSSPQFYKKYGQEKYRQMDNLEYDVLQSLYSQYSSIILNSMIYPNEWFQMYLDEPDEYNEEPKKSKITVECCGNEKQFIVDDKKNIKVIMKQVESFFKKNLDNSYKEINRLYSKIEKVI